jgi:hypothetical protein
MAQLFIDTASISNLEITRSYIGSGSTSFNKENSFLRVNNGVRQGINNRVFGTSNNSVSHIEGYNNSDTAGICHVEGYNNTTITNSNISHIEGANNIGSIYYSHIEGTNNRCSDTLSPTLGLNHIEGGFNTGSMGWGRHHIEGYSSSIQIAQRVLSHFEGANHLLGDGNLLEVSHVEGYNHIYVFTSKCCHIEGTEHSSSLYRNNIGSHNHIEGRKNLLTFGSGLSNAHNIEGYNNIISASVCAVPGIHVCGVSCSSTLTGSYSFLNGLGSQTYYPNSTSHIFGQFNTSSLSSYSNISPSTNTIRYNFTIGGGLNNNTRANIFEIAIVTSASSANINRTSSIILPWVSESGEFASDLLAAAGGIPLGGFYRTGNNLKIRLS